MFVSRPETFVPQFRIYHSLREGYMAIHETFQVSLSYNAAIGIQRMSKQ
jgi:hypothetical protein